MSLTGNTLLMKINNLPIGPGAECGYTERCAADPLHPYDGVNLCHYTNDSLHHVAECRQEFAQKLGVQVSALIIPRQAHTTNVAVINSPAPAVLDNVDALVTDRKDIVLCINTADCVPLLLHDTKAGVIAACHAGWRGAVNGVVQNTVAAMLSLGASPEHIQAAMGPCICPNCFEVGPEVADRFQQWPDTIITSAEWSKPHIDLPAVIAHILTQQGINHITPPPACTRCSWRTLFSARKLGINSGRMLSFIRIM